MRVIIAGSREFNNYELLEKECNKIFRELSEEGYHTCIADIEIVSGGARGADRLGEHFAKDYDLKVKRFIPDWDGLGKRAGFVRNEDMAIYAKQDSELGVLIACWDGVSKGTGHMINLAKKHGLRVFVINF
jgi:hypothetical protein